MNLNFKSNREYVAPYLELLQIDALNVLCVSGDGTTENLIIDENYGW